jgi:Membrane-associated phospholipid phosphatase
MQLLYILEQLRTPAVTKALSALTYFGGVYGFMVLSIIVFWCIDKRCGYFMLSLGFIGTVINQFLKILFRIPRPWVLDPSFEPVESAVADAGGFSFPSGHTQNVFATFGGVFAWTKKVWLKIVCAVLIVLVAFSRMYLGVHTPLDVGVSVVIGIVLLLALYPVFRDIDRHPNRFYGFLAVLAVLLAAFLLYSYLWPFPDWMYAEEHVVNLIEARHNASILTGALAALTIAYTLDLRRTRFDTKAVWWAQILKVVIGLVVTLALIEGTKAVLGKSDIVTGLRYFLGVLFAAGVWPMTFGWFGRLGKK